MYMCAHERLTVAADLGIDIDLPFWQCDSLLVVICTILRSTQTTILCILGKRGGCWYIS